MWSRLYYKVRAPTVPRRWPGARPTDNGTTAAPCLKGGQTLWGRLCLSAPLQTLPWDPCGTRLKLRLQEQQHPCLAFALPWPASLTPPLQSLLSTSLSQKSLPQSLLLGSQTKYKRVLVKQKNISLLTLCPKDFQIQGNRQK